MLPYKYTRIHSRVRCFHLLLCVTLDLKKRILEVFPYNKYRRMTEKVPINIGIQIHVKTYNNTQGSFVYNKRKKR